MELDKKGYLELHYIVEDLPTVRYLIIQRFHRYYEQNFKTL